jgi:hypothetical protein
MGCPGGAKNVRAEFLLPVRRFVVSSDQISRKTVSQSKL